MQTIKSLFDYIAINQETVNFTIKELNKIIKH